MSDKLISFVIPVYHKSPQVFERCLKSLFDMSYKAIEVICAFDGPDQELQKVASRYKTKELVIEHGGAPKARNAGAKLARGEYISFWDADCFAKPEMAKRWIEEFQSTEADFVYSGYEFDGHEQGINGEPFDEYLLTCQNYIASMFPIKREKAPVWDETLEGGQDWDFWLTAVQNGCRGSYIEGFGFITEAPTKDSISGHAWSQENFEKTRQRIKTKHSIPDRNIVVGSAMHKIKGLHIAKLIGADFIQFPSWRPHNYEMVIVLGFGEDIRFQNAPADCVKVMYWMPWDIDGLERVNFKTVITTLENARKEVSYHFCNEMVSQKRLRRVFDFARIEKPIEILPLPSDIDDPETKLPDRFRVLLDIDEGWLPIFRTLKQDLPYIDMDVLSYTNNPIANISDYSLLVSFHANPTIDEGIRRFLINGRNIISNVQAPGCGYFDMEVKFGAFKDELLKRIRDARFLKFNSEYQEYYRRIVDPQKFRSRLLSLLPSAQLEVVA